MFEIKELNKKDFPVPLLEIPQPPKRLRYVGEKPDWKNPVYLTIVGSRKYSSYGQNSLEEILNGLKGYPITIVSGLALGIDTLAHKKALDNNLKTIAFPGSGLNEKNLYPSANKKLAEKIISAGGTLISEYEDTQGATLYTFPQRNRLMAGLSKATLVVEASEKSGTLITARLATEYNRDVLAIPGSIFSLNSYGPNWLIKQGATPITNSQDLLIALGFDLDITFESNSQEKIIESLSEAENKIFDLLKIESLSRDELISQSKIPINELNILLSVMEIKGLIKEIYGEFNLTNQKKF